MHHHHRLSSRPFLLESSKLLQVTSEPRADPVSLLLASLLLRARPAKVLGLNIESVAVTVAAVTVAVVTVAVSAVATGAEALTVTDAMIVAGSRAIGSALVTVDALAMAAAGRVVLPMP